MKLTEQKLKEMILEELHEMIGIGPRPSAIATWQALEQSLKSKKPSVKQLESEIKQLEQILANLQKMKDQLKK